MRGRWASVLQGMLLGGAFLLASRDVERTMHQQPVNAEQNAALVQYIERRRQQGQ